MAAPGFVSIFHWIADFRGKTGHAGGRVRSPTAPCPCVPPASFQVMDVLPALGETAIGEDPLLQRHVGLDPVHHHLVGATRMRAIACSRVAPCTISLPIIES